MSNVKITGKELAALEMDKGFKKPYIPFSSKWKSWLYLAPVLLLLMSLFAALWLLGKGQLATWVVTPYAVIFVVATIWFKAVRKAVEEKLMTHPDFFITAFAKPVLTDKFMVYAIFSVGANRHNTTFIEHQAAVVSSTYADLIPQLKPKQALLLNAGTEENPDALYLCCLRKFNVRSNNIGWNEKDAFALLFVDKKQVKSIPLGKK